MNTEKEINKIMGGEIYETMSEKLLTSFQTTRRKLSRKQGDLQEVL